MLFHEKVLEAGTVIDQIQVHRVYSSGFFGSGMRAVRGQTSVVYREVVNTVRGQTLSVRKLNCDVLLSDTYYKDTEKVSC